MSTATRPAWVSTRPATSSTRRPAVSTPRRSTAVSSRPRTRWTASTARTTTSPESPHEVLRSAPILRGDPDPEGPPPGRSVPPDHHDGPVVGLSGARRRAEPLRAAGEPAADEALRRAQHPVHSDREVAEPGLDDTVRVEHQRVAPAEPTVRADVGRVVDDTEQRAGRLAEHLPTPGAVVELDRRRVPGAADRVVAGGEVDRDMDRRGEALVPVLAEQVVVGGGEEPVRLLFAEQAAERAREEQRPGARLHALARHVDEHDLEPPAVRGARRHHEVAGERLSVRRLDR